ncbi:microtubule integrity protein mal3 [Lecanora helva]
MPIDSFTKHGIERPVPVEALVKCKMQDNLEFLQWSKRYWDQYYPGGDYDALARRKGSGASASAPMPAATSRASGAGAARRGTTPTTTPGAKAARPGGGGTASAAVIAENTQLKATVEGLERERDFYFSKLRDIELLVQEEFDHHPELEQQGEETLIKQIQATLYSTEEGFEIPAEAEGGAVDDQETF